MDDQPPAFLLGMASRKFDGMSRSLLVVDKPGNISDSYDLLMQLGEGGYGTVSMGLHRKTGSRRAVKTMSKDKAKNVVRFLQEIATLKSMDHPNIVKLFETFEDAGQLHLAMELCEGKELFDRILDAGQFTERDAAVTSHQMLSAVRYMHRRGFCHRDLKPENFLFASAGPIDTSILKLIDFGLATCFLKNGSSRLMTTIAGSAYYVAPQVLQGRYNESCDIWSCGVIMYTMLCGCPPFDGDTEKEVLRKVKRGHYSFDGVEWKSISDDARNLIARMLTFEPAERCTAQQALQNSWIQESAPGAVTASLQEGMVRNLRNFCLHNRLKKAALNIIASRMTTSQLSDLRDTFRTLDANGDGLLTFEEIQDGIAKSELSDMSMDLKTVLQGVDVNCSGLVDYTEFLAAALDKRQYLRRDLCRVAFSVFDQDDDGQITLEELQATLKNSNDAKLTARTSESILQELDRDGDGMLSFEEFMLMMHDGVELSPTTACESPGRFSSQQSLLATCRVEL